ncbi:RimK family alpha-L-glutamate ligase [Candidatus Margulisiibacteriota bacterium]
MGSNNGYKQNHTLFILGDRTKDIDYQKIYRARHMLAGKPLFTKYLSYERVLHDQNMPNVETKDIVVFFFFPFYYWNKHIEFLKSAGIYGNRNFYLKFRQFWGKIKKHLKKVYPDKNFYFLNSPDLLKKYRDKILVKEIISKAGVKVPRELEIKRAKNIIEHLQSDGQLFIKPRYGSMGKGITYLTKDNWYTNFLYKDQKIVSKKADYGWHFHNGITNDHTFLERLLEGDMMVEEAVDCFTVKKKRMDFRIYVFLNEALFIYPRTSALKNITTNISQGGKGEYPSKLKLLPKTIVKKAKQQAVAAAKALGLNFAGVDVMVNNDLDKVFVIEVNSFPALPRKKVVDLAGTMLSKYSSYKWPKLSRMLKN